MRCGDNRCYPSYSSCKVLAGCTSIHDFIMCPSGKCVSNFDECFIKYYDCPVKDLIKCADGFCRESCDGIPTNGCPSNKPVYCQNGSCVKYTGNCFDYQCPMNKPILCSNNKCAESFSNCPENVLSEMIENQSQKLMAIKNSSIITTQLFHLKKDKSKIQMKLMNTQNGYYFPSYTAGFEKNEKQKKTEKDFNLEIKHIPRSDIADTKLGYFEIDFMVEKFVNKIFNRGLGMLAPYQFLRTFAFQIKLKDHGYNGWLFRRPFKMIVAYNRIHGYPQVNLNSGHEDDDDDEDLSAAQKRYNDSINALYPPSQPENYYCLAQLNPRTNIWKCANRTILEITEETIITRSRPRGSTQLFFRLSCKPRLLEDVASFASIKGKFCNLFAFICPCFWSGIGT